MYRLVKPKYFIPIHGEKRHLISHIKLVEELNGLNSKGFLLYNGDVLEIDSSLEAKTAEPIEIRNIYVDGKGVGDLEDSIFFDREQLSLNGVVVANVVAKKNKTGNYDINIDIESKGFTYNGAEKSSIISKNEELIKEGKNAATEAVRKLLNRNKRTPSTIKYEVREALRKKFIQIIGREPVIFVSLYIDNVYIELEENNTNTEETCTNKTSKSKKTLHKKKLRNIQTVSKKLKSKKIKKTKDL